MRYHINPANGEVSQCRAQSACPFGDFTTAHYPSPAAARAAYEAVQREEELSRRWSKQQMPLFEAKPVLSPEETQAEAQERVRAERHRREVEEWNELESQLREDRETRAAREYEEWRDRFLLQLRDPSKEIGLQTYLNWAKQVKSHGEDQLVDETQPIALAKLVDSTGARGDAKVAALFFAMDQREGVLGDYLMKNDLGHAAKEAVREGILMDDCRLFEEGELYLDQVSNELYGETLSPYRHRMFRKILPESHFVNGETVYLLSKFEGFRRPRNLLKEALEEQDMATFTVEKLNQALLQKVAEERGTLVERRESGTADQAVVTFVEANTYRGSNRYKSRRVAINDGLDPDQLGQQGGAYGFRAGMARVQELQDEADEINRREVEAQLQDLSLRLATLHRFLSERPTRPELLAKIYSLKQQPLEGPQVLSILQDRS